MKFYARILDEKVKQGYCLDEASLRACIAAYPESVFVEVPLMVSPDDHFFDGDSVVRKPPRPPDHYWDESTHQWYDPRTLNDFKAEKWKRIKHQRTQAIEAGFQWNANTFDSDELAQQRIVQAVQAAVAKQNNEVWTVDWTLADNSVVTLGVAEMLAVGQALQAHVAAQHARARALRVQLSEATTKDTVDALVW